MHRAPNLSPIADRADARVIRCAPMRMQLCRLLSLAVLAGPAAASVPFSNPTPIDIPDQGAADPFPSTIDVAGLTGTVTDVNVTVRGFSHQFPDDVDILLVAPNGDAMVIQADVGAGNDVVDFTYTIDDDAPVPLPSGGLLDLARGRPAEYLPSTFVGVGGPAPPYAHPATVGAATLDGFFAGIDPNGAWSLWVVDDTVDDLGVVAGGWSIELETDPPSFGGEPIAVAEIGPGAPYPAVATVTGLGDVESVRVTLHGVTHSYPDDLAVLLEAPSGDALILQSGAGGHTDADAATYVLDDLGAALPDAGALPTGGASARPTSYDDPDFSIGGGPAAPYAEPFPGGVATLTGRFAGQPANGAWKLWVVDCCAPDGGAIDGFSLTFEAPEAHATAAGVAAALALATLRRAKGQALS
jgi:subtilisin-like proprotein convertase family protein